MANHIRVTLEIGSKGKKVVAVAPDWPGLARRATTEQAAIECVRSYIPRYAPVTKTPQDTILTDKGLNAHRDAYCNAIRALHAQRNMARMWPLRYLIRHTAFHTLDHTWEMEDKDLTGKRGERSISSE